MRNLKSRTFHRLITATSAILILVAAVWTSVPTAPASAAVVDRILYSSNRGAGGYDIYAVNVDGSQERFVIGGPLDEIQAETSPDGRRIIFLRNVGTSCCGPGTDMYVADSDGSNISPLFPPDPNIDDYRADFTSDGSRISFSRGLDGVANVFSAAPDGSDVRQLTKSLGNVASWSPDGSQLVYNSGVRLWVMNSDGSNQHPITTVHQGLDTSPQWSPKGDRIAFGSTRDSVNAIAEVYTVRPDGTDLVRLTNNAAEDRYATWSPDGTHIAFTSDRQSPGKYAIWVMKADGTEQRQITSPVLGDAFPVYFPHPRPGAARQKPGTGTAGQLGDD